MTSPEVEGVVRVIRELGAEPGNYSEVDTEGRLRHYAVSRDQEERAVLARHYDSLAVNRAQRLRTRRESFEDLSQVARIGLLHALDRFDPDRGASFAGFARATIDGELKRHLRDRTWAMRVPRSLQEHFLAVVRAVDDLTAELHRSPRADEVAAATGIPEEQVLEAMELGGGQWPASFDSVSPEGPYRVGEPTVVDPGFEGVERRVQKDRLLSFLSERDRQVLRLRFDEGLTQHEIASRTGVSQMCVSRRLARILGRMRLLADG